MKKNNGSFIDTSLVIKPGIAAALAFGLLTTVSIAQEDVVRISRVNVDLDSGRVSAPQGAEGPQVVYSTVVGVDDAPWVRVEFGEVVLAGSAWSSDASRVRLTSLQDGATQNLNAETLRQWSNGSAFFNGSHVQVELIAYPGTGQNSVEIKRLLAGLQDEGEGGVATICDGVDERILWDDPRVARTVRISSGQHLARCTAFLYGHHHDRIMTAGHCIVSNLIMAEFNVPMSLPDGTPVFSHPDDQYPIVPSSFQAEANGIGEDWGLFEVYPNSNTGLTILQAQGESFYLADAAPQPSGQDVYRAGNGITTTTELPNSWNRVQKMHEGLYLSMEGTTVTHRSDTTSGDSGSPIVDTLTSLIIGVHTHAGCSNSPSSGNRGTAIHHSAFQAALAQPPGNNTCANAVNISDGPTLFTTLHALTSGPPHNDCSGPAQTVFRDVYFVYTADKPGTLKIHACEDAGFHTALAVYAGECDLNDETLLACDMAPPDCAENEGIVSIAVTAGETYTIRLGSPVAETGLGTLVLDLVLCPADLTGNGSVGVPDLLQMLGAWGECNGCIEDLTGNGSVGVPDLLELLGAWGSCE